MSEQPQFENGVPVAVNPEDQAPHDGEVNQYAVEGNDLSGYVGVSPEYATYANETEKPSLTDEEAEAAEAQSEPSEVWGDDEREESADDDEGYESKSVAELEEEVERRNASRDEDDKIVVNGTGANGNVVKADLVSALENDDV